MNDYMQFICSLTRNEQVIILLFHYIWMTLPSRDLMLLISLITAVACL